MVVLVLFFLIRLYLFFHEAKGYGKKTVGCHCVCM